MKEEESSLQRFASSFKGLLLPLFKLIFSEYYKIMNVDKTYDFFYCKAFLVLTRCLGSKAIFQGKAISLHSILRTGSSKLLISPTKTAELNSNVSQKQQVKHKSMEYLGKTPKKMRNGRHRGKVYFANLVNVRKMQTDQ